jgi:hypothetical protein
LKKYHPAKNMKNCKDQNDSNGYNQNKNTGLKNEGQPQEKGLHQQESLQALEQVR